jgi:archaemetzincin
MATNTNPQDRVEQHGVIAVLPFGKVGEDVVRIVTDGLQGVLRVPVDLYNTVHMPGDAYMESRNQFNAMAILKHIRDQHAKPNMKVLGLTEKDLGNPILTFVFGEAFLGGAAAVMSCNRLYRGVGDALVSREHFLARVIKVALHEIGHTFNLPHCHVGRCVMRASNSLAELDSKLGYLCNYCELFFFEALREAMKTANPA